MFFYALDRSKIIQEIINENIEDDPISSILDLVTHPYTISTVISFIIAILLIWASGSVLLSVVGLMASALLFSIFGMLPPEIAYVFILLAVGSLAAMIFFKR
jgi:membrane-bound ClpP family serine protease